MNYYEFCILKVEDKPKYSVADVIGVGFGSDENDNEFVCVSIPGLEIGQDVPDFRRKDNWIAFDKKVIRELFNLLNANRESFEEP
jgi:hypothetical protein